MHRADLPSDLDFAFSVREAREAGVTRSRLRAADLTRTFHGARALVGADLVADSASNAARAYPRSPAARRIHERAREYEVVKREDAYFSHLTAAVLWDAPLPRHLFVAAGGRPAAFDPEMLEVSVPWPSRAPRGGVRGHAIRPALARVVTHPVSRLRIADPTTTWAMLGGVLRHPFDLVAVADYFVRVQRPPMSQPDAAMPAPLTTIAHLGDALTAGRRCSARVLRAALERVRTGSASRPETWTRLSLVDAGLPEPDLDVDVVDEDGRFLARVDMAYPRLRIAIEYDGQHHSSGRQWESDVDRYARLEAAGWIVIRVTKGMLFGRPDVFVQRVRAALARPRP
ncbi:MAG: endonuclease domain-containing protein [Microbacterium sp.]|uniref:endonuclease domain-containing protein n=1 Tax=Microbacterium sp. TaxID=51671 RepID=UPI003A879EAA